MYRDVQEPVLNAMGGPNPFQVPIQCFVSGKEFSPQQIPQDLRGQAAAPAPTPSTETTAPAPNPWAPQGSQAAPATSGTAATPQAPGLGAALGQGGGMFTSPGMQSLMGQMRLVSIWRPANNCTISGTTLRLCHR